MNGRSRPRTDKRKVGGMRARYAVSFTLDSLFRSFSVR